MSRIDSSRMPAPVDSHPRGWSDADVVFPERAIPPDGGSFDPRETVWRWKASTSTFCLDFSSIELGAFVAARSVKALILWYIENKSGSSAYNAFERLKHFFNYFESGVRIVTAEHIINYNASLSSDRSWYLGTLAGIFRRWSQLGYPGVDPNVLRLLESMKFPGNRKGAAVLTMDPNKGPYTDVERDAIWSALNDAYAQGRISLASYVLCSLTIMLAPRPIQLRTYSGRDRSAPALLDFRAFRCGGFHGQVGSR